MRPCKTQTGGVKLRKPGSDNTGFTPVLKMLQIPDSKIEMLSYESLFGFMFELIVPPEETEYVGLNKSQKLFTVPITNFILKIVVIGSVGDGGITSRYLPDFFGTQKACELNDSFINEAKIQQDIWLSSISGGHPELCPSVANFSLFDNQNSQKLLNYLYNRETKPTITHRIISFLYELTRINAQYSIGIILMPKVMNSITMKDFGYATVHDVTLLPDQKYSIMYQAYANVIAQITRLYILTGIVHVDLHPRNILIQRDNYNHIKSQIIDFGRVVHVVEDPNNPTNPNNRKTLFDELFPFQTQRAKRRSNDIGSEIDPKEEYMNKVLRIIYPDPTKGNIRWLFNAINSLNKDIQTKILTDAFGILLYNIAKADGSKSILPQTIKSYLKNGHFFDMNSTNIDKYYFAMPSDIVQNINSTIEVPNIREQQLFLSDSDECHIPPAQKMQRDSSTLVDEGHQDANSRTIIDEPEHTSTPDGGNEDSSTIVDIDGIDGIDSIDSVARSNQNNGWTKGGNKTKSQKRKQKKVKSISRKKNKKNKTRKNNKRR